MKYYSAYEDRYKRVYAQGIEYWTNNPVEIKDTIEEINKFLERYDSSPSDNKIIEFGCGEGHLAQYLIGKGYEYVGIDISPSALEKAKDRIGSSDASKYFILGDIADLKEIPDESYDIGIDNQCLQMLVVDDDRRKYLSEIARILTKNGKAYFYNIYQEDAFEGEIRSFDEYLETSRIDLETLEDRDAYSEGQHRIIKLPRVPARFNKEKGYRNELTNAGFFIDHFQLDGNMCMIYARKRE